MKIVSTITDLDDFLNKPANNWKSIGFVPTMGALHEGHKSLIIRSKTENDLTIVSIFVNPLQFNDKKDFERYPHTLESDIAKLTAAGCDILFYPTTEEIYPKDFAQDLDLDLGMLDQVMEARFRLGHFKGVCIVVKRLFDIIKPHKAYFGEKDFQQFAIIKYMVKKLVVPIQLIACPIIREEDGLAMSSRNMLLSLEIRQSAPLIYKTLLLAKSKRSEMVLNELKRWVENTINTNPFLKLEYFEIVDSETLIPTASINHSHSLHACIAVRAGEIRLIDNIPF